MYLDSRSVYAVTSGSLAVVALIVALTAGSFPDDLRRAGRLWAIAVALSALGFGFIFVRGVVPDWLSVLGGHGTAVAGAATFVLACARFSHQRAAWTWLVLPTALALASASWFYFVRPQFALRLVVFSTLMAILMARCAALLVRQEALPTMRVVAIGFAGAALLMTARAIASLFLDPHAPPIAILQTSLLEQAVIVGFFLCYFMLSFGFVVICNERLNVDLRRLAGCDPLTGVYNRRTIEDLLRHEVARARRAHAPLAAALVDIDRFKEINDEHGHLSGDGALRAVAALLERTLRAGDLVGRYGGDEFLVLMPGSVLADGLAACERLRRAVEEAPLRDDAEHPLRLTLSIGIAACAGADADLAEVLRAADGALYDAKRGGRNRTSAREMPALAVAAPVGVSTS